MEDVTGNNQAALAATRLMGQVGEDILAEALEEVFYTHVADPAYEQCGSCLGSWPCYPWISANDQLIRWLSRKAQQGIGEA